MAIVVRLDKGIKKVGKTFPDETFLEIDAVLDEKGEVDIDASNTALEREKTKQDITPEKAERTNMHWLINEDVGEI